MLPGRSFLCWILAADFFFNGVLKLKYVTPEYQTYQREGSLLKYGDTSTHHKASGGKHTGDPEPPVCFFSQASFSLLSFHFFHSAFIVMSMRTGKIYAKETVMWVRDSTSTDRAAKPSQANEQTRFPPRRARRRQIIRT